MTDLEQAWVRQLVLTWRELNERYFRGAMKLPTLVLSDGEARLGVYSPATRQISLARAVCRDRPWGVVVEVLKHEMAHQFVYEVLKVVDESAHGPAFRGVCERMGVDAAAAGMPQAATEALPSDEYGRLLQRVTKLLALAESQNEHEARAAMSAAQKLMLKHNLDMLALHAPRGYGFRELGTPRGRIFEPERLVGCLLSDHFFVEAIWIPSFNAKDAKPGRVLEVCGTRENLDMAEYVHGFLHQTAERLWREHKKKTATRSNKDRIAFVAGVVQGFEENLAAKARENKAQGLVWVGDADLTKYYRARHPYVRHTRHVGATGDARAHGRQAGRGIVLHKPLHSHGAGAPKLLGGRQ